MKVVFTNDDFGVTYGFIKGARECYKKGLTTSVSIRTNGIYYSLAKRFLKEEMKNSGVGLHLNLTDGKKYKDNFFGYLIKLFIGDEKLLIFIEKELDDEFKIAKKDGLKIDHVDGEKHVHMIPGVFKIICRLCKKYKVRHIRMTSEPLVLPKSWREKLEVIFNVNFIKFLLLNLLAKYNNRIMRENGLYSTDAFYGVLYTNKMTKEVIKRILKDARKNGFKSIEISGHPAYISCKEDKEFTSQAMAKYSQLINRAEELKIFSDASFKKLIDKNYERVSFKNI